MFRNSLTAATSYERSYSKTGRPTSLVTVPIDEFRGGDMRKYVDSSGKQIPLYDPFDASGNIIQDPFSRPRIQCNGVLNVICPNRIDPVMKANIALLPEPDDPTKVLNNTRQNGGAVSKTAVPSIKGDYIFSDKSRISGLFSRYFSPAQLSYNATQCLPSSSFPTDVWQRFMRFNHDYVFRPNLLSHLTVGVNNRHLMEQPDNVNQMPDAWRRATYSKGTTGGPIDGKPSQFVNEWQTWGSDVYTDSIQSTWNINEQIAWIKGRHSIKFGFEYVRPDYRRIDSNYITGHVSFSAAATGNLGLNGTTSSPWVSSLLGLASSGLFAYGGDFDFVMPSYA